MKYLVKVLKGMLITIGAFIIVVISGGILFVNLSPQFGGKATEEQKKAYAQSQNYKDGRFSNIGGVKNEMSGGDMLKAIGSMLKNVPNAKPKSPILVNKIDSLRVAEYQSETRFIWFGHSTFLLQLNNKSILIDPMFSAVPAPHPLLGGKRFSSELPIEVEKLPRIDAVLLSHDHYDHLDYTSIKKIMHKVDAFFTPLGLGNHLREWGVEQEKIMELDWWQEVEFHDLTFISAPAQHFSGRGITDRDKTLWCSWIIQSESENLFFSGDSGYGSHFKTIGDKYGPFDFAMMECGQYNPLWSEIHMFPEETAQAGLDVKAKKVMPIHWGAFKLAPHAWKDPIERVTVKAKELNVDLVIPEIGAPTLVNGQYKETNNWWNKY